MRLTLLVVAVSAALSARAGQLSSEHIQSVERLVTSFMAANGIPGLSIAIVKDGELSWSNGYGTADVENFVPAKATTAYRSASMGKPMTATAAMQLVEAGRLDLHADIRQYCPAFPAKAHKITPLHLLAHTSGIRHYGGPRDLEERFSTRHYDSVAAALVPFKDDPLLFEPGTKYLYSTYGYGVLGCVVEGAARTPFLSYMATRVWQPAGMKTTRDDDPAAIVPGRAAKYIREGGELRNAPAVDMSNRMPAGGYLTTAVDLAHFAEALLAGRLVKKETFERMATATKLPDGEVVGYGLGWGLEVEPWHGDQWLFHGGSSPGASGFIAIMPKHRFAVVFMTNLEELSGRSDLAEDIARLVLGFALRQP